MHSSGPAGGGMPPDLLSTAACMPLSTSYEHITATAGKTRGFKRNFDKYFSGF